MNPQTFVKHDRGFGFHITGGLMLCAPVIKQNIPDFHSFGVKKRHARSSFMKTEKIHGQTEFPVIPLFGLGYEIEMSF